FSRAIARVPTTRYCGRRLAREWLVDCILAIDQGKPRSRPLVFGRAGHILGTAQGEFAPMFSPDGWGGHGPARLWETTLRAARGALADARVEARSLAAIGITNQRETTLIWDAETGAPVGNAIVWQDRRTAQRCERIRADGMAETIARATGLVVDP